ncbi:a disintegrin and metalloprotease domain 11 isoform 1 preproprotein-like protein [Camelus ferus]|nr:a disintegrin and metalloprotease domain 11 isoform 1 preproprotein-like protein [Camelus ferus]
MAHPKGSHPRPAQKPADSVPLSRGKELLQAAIRNQGSSSSLLSNARSWGVRILHVDEMVMYVQHLSLDALCVKKQGPEKPEVGPPTELKGNSKACDNFGKMSNRVKNTEREARDREPSPQSAARTVPRRKKGYCECCQEAFEELHRHLQSPQHRGFALEAHSYAEVDWIIAQLSHSFADIPFQASLPGTASPRRRKEDDRQAPGAPEQDGTVGDTQAPAEPVEAGKTPGPPASCQEPEELADVFVDPSGTPAYQCLLTSSGFTELSSGSDLALVGHKRKIQFPSGLGTQSPTGALHWQVSPQLESPEAPEVTEPSRLVGESSGGEVRKQQLDTRVRQEPPGGPIGSREAPMPEKVGWHPEGREACVQGCAFLPLPPGKPVHLAQVSFVIPAFNSNFTLDLELNHHLLSSQYVERHFSREGTTQHSTGAGDHCYYQGKLRGNPQSFAALSTCQGLHGVFSDGNFTYIVEPLEMAGPQEGPQSPSDAGNQVRRGHPTVHSETKYVELIVINDHQLFEQMRQSVVLTSNFAKSVVNLADVMYKEQLNTRIVLVAMETWADGDKIQVQDDLLETLARLMVYRREGLPEPSDATHLFSGRTFQSTSSGAAYVGGICSLSRGGGVNEVSSVGVQTWGLDGEGCKGHEPCPFWRNIDIFVFHLPHPKYDNMGAMAVTLAQTLGQNLGMMWNKHRSSAGDCKCPDNWLGCIMEDTGFYLPRKFSRCSIEEYNQFLQEGGGSCLFNKPLKLLDPPECGNGFVEAGEECDCGSVQECSRAGGNCCKKCTLTHDAMCSDGLCCRRCKYEPRGVSCREAVNECDIAETCTGDSSQCPPNLHKLDGYYCDHEQGRCYGGRCKTRDRQCQALWGHVAADRFCYEKLNVEGTERGNCGRKGSGWVQCNKQDVLCGFLLCVNISGAPRLGDLGGDISSVTFYHQGKELDCRGGHVQLADGSDLSYVEDGTACGPNMLCLDHRCLPASTFNFSACPGSGEHRICSHHGVCSNEGKCICQPDWTGKDCSIHNPLPTSPPTGETERYKGPSGTNIIIGSIAGAVLVAAIVLGGTGWGFKSGGA